MKNYYDVVVVGAGIGGLVCGCYLSKEGLKVLILDKHCIAGGYCTSFSRNDFRFDVGVHYLGGINGGVLGRVINELEIHKKLKFSQFSPTDTIITPDCCVKFLANPLGTLDELKRVFPEETEALDSFFRFVIQGEFKDCFLKLSRITFQDFLDSCFTNYRLKFVLGLFLSNLALSAQRASAIAAIILFKEFIFDPGYYPEGGMSALSDCLVSRCKEFGGEVLLGRKATKIQIANNRVEAVVLDNAEIIACRFLVSNIDARETFDCLISENTPERNKIENLKESLSLFVVYLGIEEFCGKDASNIWICKSYDIDKHFQNLNNCSQAIDTDFFMVSKPSLHDKSVNAKKNTLQAYMVAPYGGQAFWDRNRNFLTGKIIEEVVDRGIVERRAIREVVTATPLTMKKFTANTGGSAFGWESTVDQISPKLFPSKTSIENLYLAGHWCMLGSGQGGIPKVAFSGERASRLIINKMRS